MGNFYNHFKKVCKHKYWVGYYCFKAGIPWRGIKHDMSKFSPVEFLESVKYYQGNRSPIDKCKEVNGWSKAWQHHKGRNDHHYEYWMDDFDHGGKPLKMPPECAIEMLCDYLGAGRAYSGDSFSYADELEWWKKKSQNPLAMHPVTKMFISFELTKIAKAEASEDFNLKKLLNNRQLRWEYAVCEGIWRSKQNVQ